MTSKWATRWGLSTNQIRVQWTELITTLHGLLCTRCHDILDRIKWVANHLRSIINLIQRRLRNQPRLLRGQDMMIMACRRGLLHIALRAFRFPSQPLPACWPLSCTDLSRPQKIHDPFLWRFLTGPSFPGFICCGVVSSLDVHWLKWFLCPLGAAIWKRMALFLAKRVVMRVLGASSSFTRIIALGHLKASTTSVTDVFCDVLLSGRQNWQCFSWLGAYSAAKHVACVNGVADRWTEIHKWRQ